MTKSQNSEVSLVYPYMSTSLAIISVWIILNSLLEYFFTEHWYIFDRISSDVRTWLLVGLVVIGSASISRFNRSIKGLFITILIFMFTLLSAGQYQNYYSQLQRYPKIKSLSKNWSIQGDRITILGRNFGADHDRGSVVVGDLEFSKVVWTNNKLVLEQPVPSEFFTAPMIIRNHQDESTIVVNKFSIKDPSDVL